MTNAFLYMLTDAHHAATRGPKWLGRFRRMERMARQTYAVLSGADLCVHANSPKGCATCVSQEQKERYAPSFVVEPMGSMDWVVDDKRSHVRARLASAPVLTGPEWSDDYEDCCFTFPYLMD